MFNLILELYIVVAITSLIFSGTIVIAGMNGIWARWESAIKDKAGNMKYKKQKQVWYEGWETARDKLETAFSIVCKIVATCFILIIIPNKLIKLLITQYPLEVLAILLLPIMMYPLYRHLKGFIHHVLGTPKELIKN